MISDAQYLVWLSNRDAERCVLVEVGVKSAGAETTRYLSTQPYVDGAAGRPYLPVLVKEDLSTTEQLSLDGNPTMTIGDVPIMNIDGARDAWRRDIWSNRPNRWYLGDSSWARSDFRLIADGTTDNIGSASSDTLNLKFRDKLQLLNAAVSEAKLGGTGTNKDTLIPWAGGEVFNVTPLLVNPATLTYAVHVSAIERILEVRDNGVPIANDSIGWAAVTVNLATGQFTLNPDHAPAGTITCDVQGDKAGTYVNTVSKLIQRLVTGFGQVDTRFTSADLDAANLAAFDSAHPQAVGLYLTARTNVIPACQQLAASLDAQMVTSRLGKLQLFQLDLSSLSPTFDIYQYHLVENSLKIATITDVVGAVKLGFCQNYTPQPDLLTEIPPADKLLLAEPWPMTSTKPADSQTISDYKLTTDVAQADTCLLATSDADGEAQRRVNFRGAPHTVFQFDGYGDLFQLTLGQHVRLNLPRFDLSAGVPGIVINLQLKWAVNTSTVGVLT